MDAVFKALADETRRKLLDRLHKNSGRTLTELCQDLDMTRQAVTKHLVILETANLVVTRKRGTRKAPLPQSSADPRDLHALDWQVEQSRLDALHNLKEALKEK
jgi:DNA-binding transcriptional ArsR family regulator